VDGNKHPRQYHRSANAHTFVIDPGTTTGDDVTGIAVLTDCPRNGVFEGVDRVSDK
jgi:hypothetical protein